MPTQNEPGYSTNIGDYLVIMLDGSTYTYIAQVTQTTPLQMKIKEDGLLACLKDGDYVIFEKDTQQFQRDCRENTNVFLESCHHTHRKVHSGLNSLGVTDGKFHEILPG